MVNVFVGLYAVEGGAISNILEYGFHGGGGRATLLDMKQHVLQVYGMTTCQVCVVVVGRW